MRLLQDMGYRNVRHWSGGLVAWAELGLPLESITRRSRATDTRRRGLLERVAAKSFPVLLASWCGVVIAFGLAFWLIGLASPALLEHGSRMSADSHGLRTALYFSFVTATSVGFGDVTPVGVVRGLAVLEAVLTLLIFGVLVSKMVTRRQDELIEEIHRTTFEMRLGRVRSSLHLVLSDLQDLATRSVENPATRERLLPRIESAVLVLLGELRTVHDLLHRPQETPPEETLESILAVMASALSELATVMECETRSRATPLLVASAESVARLAGEICGECVPREHAPHLKLSMDRVQALARRVETALTH